MLTLLVLMIGGGILAGTSTMINSVNKGMRAVIVPTDDAGRTVVVTPCGTGAPISNAATTKVFDVVGVTMVELPQGSGKRIVLVPRCNAGSGAVNGISLLPSAAFVSRPGTPIPPVGSGSSSSSSSASSSGPLVADPRAATSELIVAAGSAVRTVIVSPCNNNSTGPPGTLLNSQRGAPGYALAPNC